VSTLPPAVYLTVAEAVEEGLLLTEYASRMSVKNTFLKRVLAGHESWNLARGREIASAALLALAREADGDADNLGALITRFRENPATARTTQGYSVDDLPNMEHRRDVSREVAERLREQSVDDDHLDGLVAAARRDAWREVATNIEHNLEVEHVRVDEQRMRALVTEDLAALQSTPTEESAPAEELAPTEYGAL
jgi:hypothetical protein